MPSKLLSCRAKSALFVCLLSLGAGARAEDLLPDAAAGATWEGALGLGVARRNEYLGSDKQVIKLTPVLFVRYGRFTLSNASGFVTRKADDVVRGLGLDLVNREACA